MLISMIMGCVSQETKTGLGAGVGALVGGLAAYAATKEEGKGANTTAILAGVVGGAAIGGALTHYLTKQDQEKIQDVFKTGNDNQKYSWCSAESRSMTTGNVGNCASGSKVSVTPEKEFQSSTEGQNVCRYLQIEVLDENGKLQSKKEKVCK